MTQWRDVPGYEGLYQVSDEGQVLSLRRATPHIRATPIGTNGYPTVMPYWKCAYRCAAVHVLVMEAFVGLRPEGQEVRHLDGDRTNARLDNLAYGSSSENNYDMVRHGTHHWASATHCVHGHEFSAENTFTYAQKSGRPARGCRTCRAARARAKRARLTAERNAERKAA